MATAWAVVVAALGAAFLTIVGTFWLDVWRSSRAAEANRKHELKAACAQIIAGAHKLSQRAGALHEAMLTRSGLREGLDVTMRLRKPVDQLELINFLMVDTGPMLEAQAVIWLSGNEALITSASDVILSSGEVVAKSTTPPEDRRPVEQGTIGDRIKGQARSLRTLPRDPEVEAGRQTAMRDLGRTCWRFGQVMRAQLGVADTDALLRAFPGFHEDPTAH